MIRRVLRRAGLRDFGERRLDGFAVEGANASEDGEEPSSVAYCGSADVSATMDRYRRVLERAGLLVEADPQDDQILLVARRSVTSVGRVPWSAPALGHDQLQAGVGLAEVGGCGVAQLVQVPAWVASVRVYRSSRMRARS